jgi:hypothetical protein
VIELPTTPLAGEITPEIKAQIGTAQTLFFGSMLALLRQGFDPAVVGGTLMECLANLLAQRPPAHHESDLDLTDRHLRQRVRELAAVIQQRPPVH